MPTTAGAHNRGPAVAPRNRAAILGAAARLFAERGFQVPYSVVAREAGVGQGVMYRHFPTRESLAAAVFEDSWTRLEAVAEHPGPASFDRLWDLLLDQTVATAAFVEMLVENRRTSVDRVSERRLTDLLDRTLRAAIEAGTVEPALTVDDVLLAWRMAYGVVATSVDDADLRDLVGRAVGRPRPIPRPTRD